MTPVLAVSFKVLVAMAKGIRQICQWVSALDVQQNQEWEFKYIYIYINIYTYVCVYAHTHMQTYTRTNTHGQILAQTIE